MNPFRFVRSLFPTHPAAASGGKIDLADQARGFYGQHRSGWPYVLSLLARLHNPEGILLDTFIERTFCWHPKGPRSNLRPWVGFIHVPPNVPDWFQSEQSNRAIFATRYWQESLPHCRGLFTLSAYHRRSLERQLSIPVNDLLLPTETPELTWTPERFEAASEKKLVQAGWWLRRLHTIYRIPTRSYRKIFLRVTHADIDSLLRKERDVLVKEGLFEDRMYDSAEAISFVPPDEYDRLLAESLVIVDLYDSSANNIVVECVARNTPLLVNPIEPVVEYLGRRYPFYFASMEEAAAKAEDRDLILRTHLFLKKHPLKKKLTGEYFLDRFTKSSIYRSL